MATGSTPSTAASTEVAMRSVAAASPGADAVTMMSCASSLASGSATSTVLLPVSRSMASMRRRVAAACDASSVTLSTARARPWYVVRHGTWCGSWQNGLPFPTPSTRAGPEVTLKLTLNAPAALPCTTTPAASTTVARTSATSWPSSSTLVPVAVLRDGASSVSTMAAAAPALTRTARATTAPAPSSASAVTL